MMRKLHSIATLCSWQVQALGSTAGERGQGEVTSVPGTAETGAGVRPDDSRSGILTSNLQFLSDTLVVTIIMAAKLAGRLSSPVCMADRRGRLGMAMG